MRQFGIGAFGFAVGVVVMWVWFVASAKSVPPTPSLRPATAIKVTIHPCGQLFVGSSRVVEVPSAEVERFSRLITPETYYGGGVNEFITPLIADVVVTHSDNTATHVLVRWSGVNPAMVSLDGRKYFYALNDPGLRDGTCVMLSRLNEWSANKQ